MTVKIITDTASDIPRSLASELGIGLVGIEVRSSAGNPLDTASFWTAAYEDPEPPQTAAPSPDSIVEAYRNAAEEGATQIYSLHLSSELSRTVENARIAANDSPISVEVIDTRTVSGAQGLVVHGVAAAAARGVKGDDLLGVVADLRARVGLVAVVDSLDFLRKGGRIGGAAALLGTMLKIKPVIEVRDGKVDAAGRVRTRSRAIEHLVATVREAGAKQVVTISAQADDTADLISALPAELEKLGPWEMGPVVGAHTGPGTLGLGYLRG